MTKIITLSQKFPNESMPDVDYPPEESVKQSEPDQVKMTAEQFSPRRDASIASQRLDQDDIFNNLKHMLRGEERDEFGEWRETEESRRLMNETGISRIMDILLSSANRNTILSRYDKQEISNYMKILHKNIVWQLVINRERFKIDKRDMKAVTDIIVNTLWSSLKRAQGGEESDAISGQVQTIERTVEEKESESKKSSWIPFVSGK